RDRAARGVVDVRPRRQDSSLGVVRALRSASGRSGRAVGPDSPDGRPPVERRRHDAAPSGPARPLAGPPLDREVPMTVSTRRPASLGGEPAFAGGLPFFRPAKPPFERVVARMAGPYETGMLTNGRNVRELEEKAAERLGVP